MAPQSGTGRNRNVPKRSQIEHARQMVAGYTPQDAAVRELLDVRYDEFIEAVACLTLTTRNYATTALGLAVRYALYLERLGVWSRDGDDPVPYAHRWVTKFAEQRLADGLLGAETSQSLLSGIGRVYQPALWPRPTPTLRTRNPKAPYPLAEQATFRTVASQWRAVYDDARIEATVAAGFGAGLAPADFRVVRGHHVHRDADGLVHVTVEGSTLIDRTVPVLPEWADLLADAATAMGQQLLISGLHDDNRNHTERITVPLRKFAGLTPSFPADARHVARRAARRRRPRTRRAALRGPQRLRDLLVLRPPLRGLGRRPSGGMGPARRPPVLSSTDRAAIYRTLALTPVVDDIQAALDARPGPPLSVSVHDALFAVIAAALVGPGHASRLDRSSRKLRDWDDDDQLRTIHDLVLGDDASHLTPEARQIEVRKHYRRFRRTLEAIGIRCKGAPDGISNYDHLACTLLRASTPVHARAYNSYACDSAGVQAAYRSNGATKVRNRLRQATARIRNYGNNSERERVRKMLFGFGYHFLGRFDPTGKDKTLWVAMVRLTPGSTSEVRTVESMLGTVAALGQPIMDLFVGDRAYSNSPHLRRKINAMHGDLVADLLHHQARPYRRPDVCWVYGGGLYDPATPPQLFNRPRRTPNMPLMSWLEKHDADLGPYLLAEHTQPDIYGAHRHVGNCVRYGADCVLRPDLSRFGGPTYPHAPATSQPLCAGGTTQSTRDDYDIPKAKGNGTIPTYQPMPYGTYQHAAVYRPWRSRTEGALGTITEYHGMWGGRYGFKVRNFDVLQLLALAAGVAYNLRRRGYAPSDHGTDDCKDESVLVLPVEHEKAFQRKLAARRRLREAFDPTTCREHQHPPARNLLRLDDEASDPPAA